MVSKLSVFIVFIGLCSLSRADDKTATDDERTGRQYFLPPTAPAVGKYNSRLLGLGALLASLKDDQWDGDRLDDLVDRLEDKYDGFYGDFGGHRRPFAAYGDFDGFYNGGYGGNRYPYSSQRLTAAIAACAAYPTANYGFRNCVLVNMIYPGIAN